MNRRRVAVVSPQTRLALARRSATGRRVVLPASFDAASARTVYLRQRRLAVTTTLVLTGLLVGLSVLFAAVPAVDRVRLAGVPLSWILLGAAVYPVLLALAVVHLRRAEQVEADAAAGRGTEARGRGTRGGGIAT